MVISYCSTCKGRLWQLKQSLPINIKLTSDEVEIILLDYHSDDGLQDYIFNEYQDYLKTGKLKYYKLVDYFDGFDMAFAKHIVHSLATGDILFNLDADNFIGTTIPELLNLPRDSILVSEPLEGTGDSMVGRIGIHKSNYIAIGGYHPDIFGMYGDDLHFKYTAFRRGLLRSVSSDTSKPIQQSNDIKKLNVVVRAEGFKFPDKISVVDYLGNIIEVNLNLPDRAIHTHFRRL